MSGVYASYPLTGGGGVPIHATLSAFPAGVTAGQLGVAADTLIMYVWTGSAWEVETGPGSILSIGTIDSQTPSANGAVDNSNQLIMQSASATVPGLVNNTTQTFSGNKTFTGNVLGNNFVPAFTGNAATGTITLTSTSTQVQRFSSGSGSATVVLPDATTLSSAWVYYIANDASGTITVETNGGGTLFTMPAGSYVQLELESNSFSAGQWGWWWLAPAHTQWGNATLNLGGSTGLTVPGTINNAALTASQLVVTDASKNLTSAAITNLTDAGTDGITITNGTGAVIGASPVTISQHVADTTHNGYLSSTDWNTFNNKQATITIGALDAQTANANGLALVSSVLSAQSASATSPGLVNTTTQTFAGVKTFSSAPNLSSLTASTALVLDGSKNITSLTYTSLNTNSTIVSRDVNGNSYFVNVNGASTATASSGQTITMNAGSTQIQKITGTSTVTFKLPDATTLINGNTYYFNNNSTGIVTIQDASAGAITTVQAGAFLQIICTDNTTTAGVWDAHWLMPSSAVFGTAGLTVSGTISGTQLISTVSTGTAPLTVSSTTQVANLNAATAGSATTATNLAGGAGGSIPYQSAANTTAMLANGSSGQVLVSNGGTAAPSWGTVLTNPMTTGGDTIYGGGGGAPTRLANGSAGQVLTSAGGTSAPSWTTTPGSYYWNGYYSLSSSNYWTNTSTGSPGNFTVNGTIPGVSNGLTANWTTVSNATSNLPGVNFSAPRSGVLKLTVTASIIGSNSTSGNQTWEVRLYESTTATGLAYAAGNSPGVATANNTQFPVSLTGYFVTTASTTYNFIVQGYNSGGTMYLGGFGSNQLALQFAIEYIS